jgi:hypothetical protein
MRGHKSYNPKNKGKKSYQLSLTFLQAGGKHEQSRPCAAIYSDVTLRHPA